MTSSVSSVSGRSPITIAAGFLGAFIVGSLAVQLVRSQTATMSSGVAGVEPVIAGHAALWAPLAERDFATAATTTPTVKATTSAVSIDSVVGSEATLWAPLSDR